MAAAVDRSAVIAAVEGHVRDALAGVDGSHDWLHIERVRALALRIAADEGLPPDRAFAVELGALLHDIKDWKYQADAGPKGDAHALACAEVEALLPPLGVAPAVVDRVCEIIRRVGFKDELPSSDPNAPPPPELSVEAKVVQDADRLDAIGAIGIARCFTFGGKFSRPLYDPSQPPRAAEALTREAYMGAHASDAAAADTGKKHAANAAAGAAAGGGKASAPRPATINHFHEKLLTLKGRMKTATGRALAEARHDYMEGFLRQFDEEVAGRA